MLSGHEYVHDKVKETRISFKKVEEKPISPLSVIS